MGRFEERLRKIEDTRLDGCRASCLEVPGPQCELRSGRDLHSVPWLAAALEERAASGDAGSDDLIQV